MTALHGLAGALALALVGYLLVALFAPERLQ